MQERSITTRRRVRRSAQVSTFQSQPNWSDAWTIGVIRGRNLSRSVLEYLSSPSTREGRGPSWRPPKKDPRATEPAGEAEVETWFVSTAARPPGEPHFALIWTMAEFETEAAARRYAKEALSRGLRVEAGTLPGPQVHVPWRKAVAWAASADTGLQSADEPSWASRLKSTTGESTGVPDMISASSVVGDQRFAEPFRRQRHRAGLTHK